MISAVILVCSLSDPTNCASFANQVPFPTMEMCQQDRPNAEVYAQSLGAVVVGFTCVNWGEAT